MGKWIASAIFKVLVLGDLVRRLRPPPLQYSPLFARNRKRTRSGLAFGGRLPGQEKIANYGAPSPRQFRPAFQSLQLRYVERMRTRVFFSEPNYEIEAGIR